MGPEAQPSPLSTSACPCRAMPAPSPRLCPLGGSCDPPQDLGPVWGCCFSRRFTTGLGKRRGEGWRGSGEKGTGRHLLHLPGDLPRHGAPAQAGSAQKIGCLPLLRSPLFPPPPPSPLSLWPSPTSPLCPCHVQVQWSPNGLPLVHSPNHSQHGAFWRTFGYSFQFMDKLQK